MSAKNTTSKISTSVPYTFIYLLPFFNFSFTNKDLPVNVSANISVQLGGKPRKISVGGVAGVEVPAFKHSGQIIVFEVPSSYCSPV